MWGVQRALTNINQSVTARGGRTTFDREWDGRPALEAALGADGTTMLVALTWSELGVRPGETSLRLGLFRAEKPAAVTEQLSDGGDIDGAMASEIEGGLIWSAWTDPGDDVVDFHRTAFLGELELLEPEGGAAEAEAEGEEEPGVIGQLVNTVRGWFGAAKL